MLCLHISDGHLENLKKWSQGDQLKAFFEVASGAFISKNEANAWMHVY